MVAVKFLALSLMALASAAPSPPQERDELPQLELPEGLWTHGDWLCYSGGHVDENMNDHPNEPCPPESRAVKTNLNPRLGGSLLGGVIGSITGALKGTVQGLTGGGAGIQLPNGNLIGAGGCAAGPCSGGGGGGGGSGGYCWRPC